MGPKPTSSFVTNGCTASPDYLDGRALWPACVIHDYHYSPQSPVNSRLRADSILGVNIFRLLRLQGTGWFKSISVGVVYTTACQSLGKPFYKYNADTA